MDQIDRPTERIRVLVADDHPVFRRGMRAILGAEPDTELARALTHRGQAYPGAYGGILLWIRYSAAVVFNSERGSIGVKGHPNV